MKKEILASVFIILILLNLIGVMAEEPDIMDAQPSFNLRDWLRHTFKIGTFSVVGDSLQCDRTPYRTFTVQQGETFNHIAPEYCPGMTGLWDIYTGGRYWREYYHRMNVYFSSSWGTIELYCCKNPQPQDLCSTSPTQPSPHCNWAGEYSMCKTVNCNLWRDDGYQCTIEGITEGGIPYYTDYVNYCTTSVVVECWYYDKTQDIDDCLSRKYLGETRSCSEIGTYGTSKLYSSKSVCESNIPTPTTWTCTDSDGGKEIYTKGRAYGIKADGQSYEVSDSCGVDNNRVSEVTCVNSMPNSEWIDCPSGQCQDGKCTQSLLPSTPCEQLGGTCRLLGICSTNTKSIGGLGDYGCFSTNKCCISDTTPPPPPITPPNISTLQKGIESSKIRTATISTLLQSMCTLSEQCEENSECTSLQSLVDDKIISDIKAKEIAKKISDSLKEAGVGVGTISVGAVCSALAVGYSLGFAIPLCVGLSSTTLFILADVFGLLSQSKLEKTGLCVLTEEEGEGFCFESVNKWMKPITKSDNCQTNTIVFIVISFFGILILMKLMDKI